MPVIPSTEYLDSGGGNWYSLYSHLNRDTLVFPAECIEYLREGNDRYSDCLEFFDDKLWLHTINGSLYKVVHDNNEKNNLVKQRLDRILHA